MAAHVTATEQPLKTSVTFSSVQQACVYQREWLLLDWLYMIFILFTEIYLIY